MDLSLKSMLALMMLQRTIMKERTKLILLLESATRAFQLTLQSNLNYVFALISRLLSSVNGLIILCSVLTNHICYLTINQEQTYKLWYGEQRFTATLRLYIQSLATSGKYFKCQRRWRPGTHLRIDVVCSHWLDQKQEHLQSITERSQVKRKAFADYFRQSVENRSI